MGDPSKKIIYKEKVLFPKVASSSNRENMCMCSENLDLPLLVRLSGVPRHLSRQSNETIHDSTKHTIKDLSQSHNFHITLSLSQLQIYVAKRLSFPTYEQYFTENFKKSQE